MKTSNPMQDRQLMFGNMTAFSAGTPIRGHSRQSPSLLRPLIGGLFVVSGLLVADRANAADVLAKPAVPAKANATPEAPVEENYSFNMAFIRGSSEENALDLNALTQGNELPTGSYNVDLFLNGNYKTNLYIYFNKVARQEVQACVPYSLLISLGVKESAINAPAHSECITIQNSINGATELFEPNKLRLTLSIPESEMYRQDPNDVPMSEWNAGQSALFINYMASYYRVNNKDEENTSSQFLSANSGINLGLWRLRNQSIYSKDNKNSGKVDSVATYAERAVASIKAELTVGETFTAGRVFDGIAFRGVRLASDDRMLPSSQRGYAPTVRGIANSNARVRVFQGNILIHEMTVAPGAFEINDLAPITFGGDLRVLVTESDGQTNQFVVPYSSLSESLRPGLGLFSLTAGQTHQSDREQVGFTELTYEYGLDNRLTLSGGIQISDKRYKALTTGLVLATDFGAFGFNSTYSDFMLNGQQSDGWMVRTSYSRKFTRTDTNLTLANHRYQSAGFLTLSDSLQQKNGVNKNNTLHQDGDQIDSSSTFFSGKRHQQNRFDIRISQGMGRYGSIFANAMLQNYHNDNNRDIQYQLGYANNYRNVSYTTSILRQESRTGKANNIFTFGFSVPLGSNAQAPLLSMSMAQGSQKQSSVQSRVSGSLGEDRQLQYAVNANRDMHRNVNSAGVMLNKTTAFGSYGASYNQSHSSKQFSANAQGGAVFHSGGVTLSPYLSDTFAIVEAKGASGAKLTNVYGAKIDSNGYAIVPSLSPYNHNVIDINPQDTNSNVEFKQTQKHVAPYAGAIVKIEFPTTEGFALLITGQQQDAKPLPMGALVFDEQQQEIGMVGQGSRIYARVEKQQGQLQVRWGMSDSQFCTISYSIADKEKTLYLIERQATCSAP